MLFLFRLARLEVATIAPTFRAGFRDLKGHSIEDVIHGIFSSVWTAALYASITAMALTFMLWLAVVDPIHNHGFAASTAAVYVYAVPIGFVVWAAAWLVYVHVVAAPWLKEARELLMDAEELESVTQMVLLRRAEKLRKGTNKPFTDVVERPSVDEIPALIYTYASTLHHAQPEFKLINAVLGKFGSQIPPSRAYEEDEVSPGLEPV